MKDCYCGHKASQHYGSIYPAGCKFADCECNGYKPKELGVIKKGGNNDGAGSQKKYK